MSVVGIVEHARRAHDAAEERLAAFVCAYGSEINALAFAFDLEGLEMWTVAGVTAVAGVLLRMMPEEDPYLLYAAVERWHIARSGVVVDDQGDEMGHA